MPPKVVETLPAPSRYLLLGWAVITLLALAANRGCQVQPAPRPLYAGVGSCPSHSVTAPCPSAD
jgi:hypothetical protein